MTDPIKDLRKLRPTPDDGWATSNAGVDVMSRAIAMGENDAHAIVEPPKRRRRRYFWGGTAAVVVIASGAAAGYFHFNQPRATDEGGCYQTLQAEGDGVVIAVPPNSAIAKLGIIQACLNEVPPDWGYQDANLVVCVSGTGGVGVFPAPKGEDDATACPTLGDWTQMPSPATPTQ